MKIQQSKVPRLKEGISIKTKVLKRTNENGYQISKIPRIDNLCSIKKNSNSTRNSYINPSTLINKLPYAQINKETCHKVVIQRAKTVAFKENIVNKNFNVSFKKKKIDKKLHTTKEIFSKSASTLEIYSRKSLCPKIIDTSRRVSIYYSSNLQLPFKHNNEPSALTEIDTNRQSLCNKPVVEDVFTALDKYDFVKDTPRGKPGPFKNESLVNHRLSIYNLPQNFRPTTTIVTPTQKGLYANSAASRSSLALSSHITPQKSCPKVVPAAPLSSSRPPPNSIYRSQNFISLSALSTHSNTMLNRYALKMNGLLSQSYSYKCPTVTSSSLISLAPSVKKGDEVGVKGSILKKAPAPVEFAEDSLVGCNKVEKKKKVVKWKDDVPIQSPFAARNSGFKHRSPPPQLFEISVPAQNESGADIVQQELANDNGDLKNELASDENETVATEDLVGFPFDITIRDGHEESPGADFLTEKFDMLELSADLNFSYFNHKIPSEKSLKVPFTPASLLDNSLLRAFDPLVSS